MDDLFPKVTNFYFVKTYSLANKSTKKVLAPYLLGGIAAVAAFTVWVVVKDGTFDPATANMVYEIGKEHSDDRSALQLSEKTSVAYERG